MDTPKGIVERMRQRWRSDHPDARDDQMPVALRDASSVPALVDSTVLHEHFCLHPDPVKGCEWCDVGYAAPHVLLPKADARVNYRRGSETERCFECRFYQWGACSLVEGTIEAQDLCDLRLPQPQTFPDEPVADAMFYSTTSKRGGTRRLFTTLPRKFAEAPEWINVLPKPGSYSHPLYGMLAITSKRNANFVKNFDDQVYQKDIPIQLDLEHEIKLSGAVGYFAELRQNTDGSVDAKVTWNERGRTLIEQDAYKYFSPEFFDVWSDPATDQVYTDVLIGGALTTRPFFKESALRPLVANEGGMFAAETDGSSPTMWLRQVPPVVAKETVVDPKDVKDPKETEVVEQVAVATKEPIASVRVGLSEDEVKQFREWQAGEDAKSKTLSELQATVTTLSETNAKLVAEQRRKTFSETVRGTGGQNDGGSVWPGGIEENVSHLIKLAESVGEDAEVFTEHVARMNEAAKTLKSSKAFSSIGSQEPGNPDAEDNVETKIGEAMKANDKLSRRDAMSQVFREHPGLYERHRRDAIVQRDDA